MSYPGVRRDSNHRDIKKLGNVLGVFDGKETGRISRRSKYDLIQMNEIQTSSLLIELKRVSDTPLLIKMFVSYFLTGNV
jgi:hypothetical protein